MNSDNSKAARRNPQRWMALGAVALAVAAGVAAVVVFRERADPAADVRRAAEAEAARGAERDRRLRAALGAAGFAVTTVDAPEGRTGWFEVTAAKGGHTYQGYFTTSMEFPVGGDLYRRGPGHTVTISRGGERLKAYTGVATQGVMPDGEALVPEFETAGRFADAVWGVFRDRLSAPGAPYRR